MMIIMDEYKSLVEKLCKFFLLFSSLRLYLVLQNLYKQIKSLFVNKSTKVQGHSTIQPLIPKVTRENKIKGDIIIEIRNKSYIIKNIYYICIITNVFIYSHILPLLCEDIKYPLFILLIVFFSILMKYPCCLINTVSA